MAKKPKKPARGCPAVLSKIDREKSRLAVSADPILLSAVDREKSRLAILAMAEMYPSYARMLKLIRTDSGGIPSEVVDLLAREYGWTWSDIAQLTPAQLFDHITTLLKRQSPDGIAPTPIPQAPVELHGVNGQPIIHGKAKKRLRPSQYSVVAALLAAGEFGLTNRELVKRSGRTDARGILKRLARDRDWSAVIQFPGETGGGNRIC